MNDPVKAYITEFLKKTIFLHDLRSGQIIFEYDRVDNVEKQSDIDRVKRFFERHSIHAHRPDFTLSELTREEAMISIRYGLSTKLNYTLIGREFSESDQNLTTFRFFDLFDHPCCYTVNTRIWQKPLDLNDFWETGGAILLDKEHIGIFWTNDLYDCFG